jgi:phosphoglycerate dehydrogenase-like enzyme
MLAERDGFALRDRTVGIVGVGNVGGRLQKRLEALGSKRCCAIRRAPIAATKATSARRAGPEADV